jgi:hypothetical protein
MARPRAVFRPTFTLTIAYFLLFLLLYLLLLVMPVLWPLLSQPVAVGDEQRMMEEAQRLARDAAQGRVFVAVIAAIATLGLGAWAGVLPGLKKPGDVP